MFSPVDIPYSQSGSSRRSLRAVAAATLGTNIFLVLNDEVRSVPGQEDGYVEIELSAADNTRTRFLQHPMMSFIYFLYLSSM